MADPSPAPVGKVTARSGAIYNSADLLYELIEAETAYAIKPYQDLVQALQRKLDTCKGALDELQQAGNRIEQGSAQPEIEAELNAIKSALADSGLGIASGALCFVGERAAVVSIIGDELKRLAPNPNTFAPITPASVVHVLVQGFADCKQKLEEDHKRYDDLKKTLVLQEAREAAEGKQLKQSLKEEQDKVAALTRALALLRAQATEQVATLTESVDTLTNTVTTLESDALSARTESDEWKAKYEAIEAERDSLKTALETSEGKLASALAHGTTLEVAAEAAKKESDGKLQTAREELDEWRTNCIAAEAELKTAKDEGAATLAALQSEVDTWKARSGTAESDLKTATDEGAVTLAAVRSEVEIWKARSVTAEADLKTSKDDGAAALAAVHSEVETWKTRSGIAEGERDSTQSELQAANTKLTEHLDTAKTGLAEWTAKAAAWDAERTRHKSQTERNASLITRLQSELAKLKAKLESLETERDQLKSAVSKLHDIETERRSAQTKLDAAHAERDALKDSLHHVETERNRLETELPALQTRLHGAEAERNQLQTDHAQTNARNSALTAELEDLKKKHTAELEELRKKYTAATTSTISPKPPASMFIKPRQTPVRPNIQDKAREQGSPTVSTSPINPSPLAPPRRTSTTPGLNQYLLDTEPAATPTPVLGPVVGLQGRVSVRRNVAASPTIPSTGSASRSASGAKPKAATATATSDGATGKPKPRSPPVLATSSPGTGTGGDILRAAPSLARVRRTPSGTPATPAASSSSPAASSPRGSAPSTAKRSADSSTYPIYIILLFTNSHRVQTPLLRHPPDGLRSPRNRMAIAPPSPRSRSTPSWNVRLPRLPSSVLRAPSILTNLSAKQPPSSAPRRPRSPPSARRRSRASTPRPRRAPRRARRASPARRPLSPLPRSRAASPPRPPSPLLLGPSPHRPPPLARCVVVVVTSPANRSRRDPLMPMKDVVFGMLF
ncbi:hypothetical protein DFH06DRAFT_264979 [Mycena polygramma]|nr:hypothetical protein DFH06DRAFT_264979 [Mycena polygramma]